MQPKHHQSAAEIGNRAADWLVRRYDSEGWSEIDQVQLDSWLTEALAHKIAYLRVEAASKRADRLGALRRPATVRGRIIPALKAVAVAVAIVVVFGASLFAIRSGAPEKTYVTGVGGHETLTLRDGSRIELNTDTSLRIADSGAERVVSLDRGEAYFQIVHDAAHPFVVLAGDHRITDLGTKFLVRRNDDVLRVALLQGQAQFDTEDSRGRQQATLNPGDVVVATAMSLSIAQAPTQILDDQLGWRRGVLVFRHATLAEAAAEFNRYNLQKIVIADSHIARLNINGALRANDPQTFVRSMKMFFDIRAEVRSDAIILSR
jgi:transmembrane sensor